MSYHSSLRLNRLIRRLILALLIAAAATPVSAAADNIDTDDTDNPSVLARLSSLPAPQTVSIPWRPGRFTEFQAGSDEEGGVRARRGHLIGQLYRAPHSGTAPYAVLLAGCGGTYTGANSLWLKLWARNLQDIGVGTLALDSIEARGVKNGVCGDGSEIWALRRVDDAHAAMAWLVTQPWVDGRRIIVMGMSNGGRAALLSVSATENARFRQFAAAVAFYPTCERLPPHHLLTSALLLIGGADENASPAKCERFTTRRLNAAFPPQIRVYPKASHLFDVYPRDDDYDKPEVIESRIDVLAFLRQVLNIAESTEQQSATPPR